MPTHAPPRPPHPPPPAASTHARAPRPSAPAGRPHRSSALRGSRRTSAAWCRPAAAGLLQAAQAAAACGGAAAAELGAGSAAGSCTHTGAPQPSGPRRRCSASCARLSGPDAPRRTTSQPTPVRRPPRFVCWQEPLDTRHPPWAVSGHAACPPRMSRGPEQRRLLLVGGAPRMLRYTMLRISCLSYACLPPHWLRWLQLLLGGRGRANIGVAARLVHVHRAEDEPHKPQRGAPGGAQGEGKRMREKVVSMVGSIKNLSKPTQAALLTRGAAVGTLCGRLGSTQARSSTEEARRPRGRWCRAAVEARALRRVHGTTATCRMQGAGHPTAQAVASPGHGWSPAPLPATSHSPPQANAAHHPTVPSMRKKP